MVNWIGLFMPVAYLGLLVGSLATFSSLYRQRKASKAASLAPWFDPHVQRNIYLSLLHIDPESGTKVPESVLKAALLRRATEDIHRLVALRNQKQAVSNLLQRGSVGDELWARFQRAEKEMEEELKDVVAEANAFAPNWGQIIFQSANEVANNQLIRKHIDELQSHVPAEKDWWDKKRSSTREEFMKELENENPLASPKSITSMSVKSSDDDAVMVETGGPIEQHSNKKKKKGKR